MAAYGMNGLEAIMLGVSFTLLLGAVIFTGHVVAGIVGSFIGAMWWAIILLLTLDSVKS